MHRGFNQYYREGLKLSGKTIYRNKCFFRYLLYFLAEFFGRILIIFNLHFNLAAVRQGYVIRKENRLDFSSSFANVGRRSQFGTYLLALCFEGLILLAGIAASGILAVILGSIGYGVSKIVSYENYELLVLLFAAPAAPILALYVLVNALIFSPTAYVIANNEGVSAGETIGACYRSMINNGKFTVFFSYLVSNLLKLLYLAAFGIGGYFVLTTFVPEKYFLLALIGWTIVSFAGYLTFAPILTLTNRVVKEHLFEDIVLDPAVAVRINEKVNLSVCKGKSLKSEPSRNLASLFEYTEDPYRILEATERKSRQLNDSSLKAKKKPSGKTAAKRKGPPQRRPAPESAVKAAETTEKTAETETQEDIATTVEVQTEATPVVEVRSETTPVVEAGETATANQPLN